MRYRTLGRVQAIQDSAKALYERMAKATEAERKAVYDYLTDAAAPVPTNIPADIAAAAQQAKAEIIQIGRDLISKGILTKKQVEGREGSYLPRMYLQYLLADGGFSGDGSGRYRAGDMGYTKKLGDLPEDIRAAMGEIKDPSFLTLAAMIRPRRDMAAIDFLADIAHTGLSQGVDWILPKSVVKWRGKVVTPYWLASQAKLVRENMLLEKDPATKQVMEDVAKDMEDHAKPIIDENRIPENYRQVPNLARYGALRGMVIRREIYEDVVGGGGTMAEPNAFNRLFGDGNSYLSKGVQLWKLSKTVYNLPAHCRQFVSNMFMLNLAGVPLHKLMPLVARAGRDIRNDGPAWRIAKEYGVEATNMTENELKGALDGIIKYADKTKGILPNIPGLNRVFDLVVKGPAKLYALNDTLFKVATIMHELEQNKKLNQNVSPEEKTQRIANAVIKANRYFLDYSDVHSWVKSVRNSPIGMPFITYQYKVAPIMIETLLKEPWKFAPYLSLYIALPLATMAMQDINDDDVDKLRKAMSKYLRDNPSVLPLPIKDSQNRWQFMDVGYLFPWSMFTNLAAAAYKVGTEGDLQGLIRATNTLSSPVLTIPAALLGNVDTFTGKQIVNEYDTPRDKVMSMIGYTWGQIAPTFLSGYGAVGKIAMDQVMRSGQGLDRNGEPTQTMGQLGASLVGFNIYPVDPVYQRMKNLSQMEYELGKIEARMSYAMNDRGISADQRRAIKEDYTRMLREKAAAMRQYAKDTELPDYLKAKK
jgi:hypothetical protein